MTSLAPSKRQLFGYFESITLCIRHSKAISLCMQVIQSMLDALRQPYVITVHAICTSAQTHVTSHPQQTIRIMAHNP